MKVIKAVAAVGFIAIGVLTGGVAFLPGTALAFSVGSGTFLAMGLAVGSSLLARKPKMPANSNENANRLRANLDVNTTRKTVFGRTAMATDIRDEEFTDSQTYLHRFIVVAAHKVNAITEIWFDDELAWTSAAGPQGKYTGYLTVTAVTEGSAGAAINISARMGATRRYTGCAYVYLRYKLTGNTKKTDSPFAQSVTTRITIKGDGAFVYDPRLDGTVPGGSGSHSASNQATWIWDANACRNPALALLFYLLGWKINGELSVGKGIPPSRIDLESFAVAANICDESVAKPGGGTEPRYRCDGVWSEGDDPSTVLDMLKACMNADLDDVDGKLRVTIFRDDTAVSDADFTDDDIIGDYDWEPHTPLDQSFNIIRGTHTDASNNSLYQQVDYPQVKVTSEDGIDRIEPFHLPMVESVGQAQRLAGLRLKRQQFGGMFRAEFQATAWRVEKNSIVRLTFSRERFVTKVFRVAEIDLREDGVVPLVLREEDPSIYVAPALQLGVAPVASTPYDPFKSPVIDALLSQDRIRNAKLLYPRNTSNIARKILIASDAGSTVTVSVARHSWSYPDSTSIVVREEGNVLAMPFDSVAYIYFEDSTLANGNPVYQYTLDPFEAVNSSAHPHRHPVGMVKTPVDGGAATSGSFLTSYGYADLAASVVDDTGIMKADTIGTTQIRNGSLLASGYAENGGQVFIGNETFLEVFGSTVNTTGPRLVIDFNFVGRFQITNPVNGSTYSFNLRGAVINQDTLLASVTDYITLSYRWNAPTATGTFYTELVNIAKQWTIDGQTPGPYKFGASFEVPNTFTYVLERYRYVKGNDVRKQ